MFTNNNGQQYCENQNISVPGVKFYTPCSIGASQLGGSGAPTFSGNLPSGYSTINPSSSTTSFSTNTKGTETSMFSSDSKIEANKFERLQAQADADMERTRQRLQKQIATQQKERAAYEKNEQDKRILALTLNRINETEVARKTLDYNENLHNFFNKPFSSGKDQIQESLNAISGMEIAIANAKSAMNVNVEYWQTDSPVLKQQYEQKKWAVANINNAVDVINQHIASIKMAMPWYELVDAINTAVSANMEYSYQYKNLEALKKLLDDNVNKMDYEGAYSLLPLIRKSAIEMDIGVSEKKVELQKEDSQALLEVASDMDQIWILNSLNQSFTDIQIQIEANKKLTDQNVATGNIKSWVGVSQGNLDSIKPQFTPMRSLEKLKHLNSPRGLSRYSNATFSLAEKAFQAGDGVEGNNWLSVSNLSDEKVLNIVYENWNRFVDYFLVPSQENIEEEIKAAQEYFALNEEKVDRFLGIVLSVMNLYCPIPLIKDLSTKLVSRYGVSLTDKTAKQKNIIDNFQKKYDEIVSKVEMDYFHRLAFELETSSAFNMVCLKRSCGNFITKENLIYADNEINVFIQGFAIPAIKKWQERGLLDETLNLTNLGKSRIKIIHPLEKLGSDVFKVNFGNAVKLSDIGTHEKLNELILSGSYKSIEDLNKLSMSFHFAYNIEKKELIETIFYNKVKVTAGNQHFTLNK